MAKKTIKEKKDKDDYSYSAESDIKQLHKSNTVLKNLLIVVVIVIVGIAGYSLAYFTTGTGNVTNVVADNGAQLVEAGNTIKVDYIGKLESGEVFDTSVQEVGEEAGIGRGVYEPLEFIVGSQQVIAGFDDAVIGMKIGDKKTVTILPEDGYGEYDENNVQQLSRERILDMIYELDKTLESLPVDTFVMAFQTTPEEGGTAELNGITYIIDSVDEESVVLSYSAEVGDVINPSGNFWDSEVIEITNEKIILEHQVNDGDRFDTQIGYVMIEIDGDKIIETSYTEKGSEIVTQYGQTFVVSDIDDEFIYIDLNNPLSGKTLIFDIELVEIVE
ncbi:peptidylprolyl isomerase [Candidatus Aenigmatarchaeota archaeon]